MNPTANQQKTGGITSAVGAIIAVVVLVIAALLVRAGSPSDPGSTENAPAEPQAAAEATGEVTEVDVTIEGMSYVPGTIEVPAGNTLVINLHNTGDQSHDLIFETGATTGVVNPGGSARVDAGVISDDTEGWCTLPGHRQMGMVLQVKAVGAPAASPDHDMATHEVATASGLPSMDRLIEAAAEVEPYPARLERTEDKQVREYTFEVTESEDNLSEAVVRPMWTYNETSPGPTLRGNVGDTFKITLVNKGTMGHSIDFHAGVVAPDKPMRTIEPGESLVYEFEAPASGIWMYHCGTVPMSLHIANGMFGAVIIDPPGLPEVDQEYVLIQSDVVVGDDAPEKLVALDTDLVAFNGRPFQYDAHPLTAKVGERVRIWLLDVGPNQPLAFHIVGTQFDTVWSEGRYSVYRGESTDGITQGPTAAQVVSLMAAEGAFVEFVPLEAGHYTMVNHIMSLAEAGAHGTLEVTP